MRKKYIVIMDDDPNFTGRVFNFFKELQPNELDYIVRTANTLEELLKKIKWGNLKGRQYQAVFSRDERMREKIVSLGIKIDYVLIEKSIEPDELKKDIDNYFLYRAIGVH